MTSTCNYVVYCMLFTITKYHNFNHSKEYSTIKLKKAKKIMQLPNIKTCKIPFILAQIVENLVIEF